MARTNGYRAEAFINAIPGTGGVISTIARKVGCSWHTAQKYIAEKPTVKQAYDDECSRITDAARSVVINEIVKKKKVETAKWWLVHKAKDEFSTRQELTGKDGDDLAIRFVWKDDDKDD